MPTTGEQSLGKGGVLPVRSQALHTLMAAATAIAANVIKWPGATSPGGQAHAPTVANLQQGLPRGCQSKSAPKAGAPLPYP